MAQNLQINVKVDGKEIDVAKLSTKELTTQISDLRKKLEETPIGSVAFKQINGDIQELEKGFRKAKDAQQPFLESMTQLDGILGYVGRSVKGVMEAFELLEMNPIVAVITALAFVVKELGSALGGIKSVAVEVEDAETQMSVAFGRLKDQILSPLIDKARELAKYLGKFFENVGVSTGVVDGAAKALDGYNEQLKKLALTEGSRDVELEKQRERQRKDLELGGDINNNIKDRINYYKDAIHVTDTLANINTSIATVEAQQQLQKLTNIHTSGQAQVELTNLIKKGDVESLADAFEKLEQTKKLSDEEISVTTTRLNKISNIAEDKANQDRAINRRLNALTNKDKNADEKEQTEFQKIEAEIRAKIIENSAQNEIEKVRATTKNEEVKLKESIDSFKGSAEEKKKLLDLYSQYVVLKEAETAKKVNEIEDKEFDKSFKAIQDADNDEIKLAELKYQKLKLLYGEDSEEAKKALEDQYLLQDKLIKEQMNILYEKQSAGYNLTDAEIQLLNKLKIALSELDLAKIKSGDLDDKVIKKFNETTKQYQNEYLGRLKFTMEYYDQEKKLIADSQLANETLYKNNKKTYEKYLSDKAILDRADIDLDKAKAKAEEENLGVIANALGVASQIAGQKTEEGKALAVAQATIDTYAAANKALDAYDPPFSFIAAAATIAEGLMNVEKILSVTTTTPSLNGVYIGKNYGDGGLIDGPSHAQGGTPINAEGGEAVMTKGAVTMFAPLLSAMNQMGGGTSFNKTATAQARYDNPQLAQPNKTEQPIFKTYVVESDMTSIQQKQARLKRLSTL